MGNQICKDSVECPTSILTGSIKEHSCSFATAQIFTYDASFFKGDFFLKLCDNTNSSIRCTRDVKTSSYLNLFRKTFKNSCNFIEFYVHTAHKNCVQTLLNTCTRIAIIFVTSFKSTTSDLSVCDAQSRENTPTFVLSDIEGLKEKYNPAC